MKCPISRHVLATKQKMCNMPPNFLNFAESSKIITNSFLFPVASPHLDQNNFSLGSEAITRKIRIIDVVYNSANNELVCTKTLVKNAIIRG